MFGKFMNKKFFHPGSYPNVKMKWIHEQRDAAKKKSEEEKQATYQKEQESYQSRMLSAKSTEEKMKLDLNFLYDLPPGIKNDEKEEEEENKEREVKFEWQKCAPRSKYINDLGLECADQPFGVCVRNIRCFKCRAWGHQNTDRECPLFFANVNSEAEGNIGKSNLRLSDPLLLVGIMKEQHGLTLKKSVIGKEIDPMAENQQLIGSDIDDDELGNEDLKFVQSLSNKQKRRLLKRLNKLETNEQKIIKKKEKYTTDEKSKKIDCSISEDVVKSYKKQNLSSNEDCKTEYDYKIYNRKCKDEKNIEDNGEFSKKHKMSIKYENMNKHNEFDFNIHKKVKMSITESGGKSGRDDNCYKKRKRSGSECKISGDDNYYKKGNIPSTKVKGCTVDSKHLNICNEDTHNKDVRKKVCSSYNERNYKSHEYEDCSKNREANSEYAKECNIRRDHCNKSNNGDISEVTKRRLTCKSYDEIDEKLFQIRNGIVNK